MRPSASLIGLRPDVDRLLAAVHSFSEKARGLAAERTRWAHDPLVGVANTAGDPLRFEITAERNLVYKFKKVDMTKIKDLERRTWQKVGAFRQLADQVRRELPPLPNKRPAPSDTTPT